MPNHQKILQIITGLDHGGAEKVVLDLCTGLMEKGFVVYCLALSNKKAMYPAFEKAGIRIISLDLKKNPVSFITNLIRANKFLKSKKIDLIHAHMVHAMVFGSILRLFNRSVPLIYTPHSIQFGIWYRKWLIKILKSLRSQDVLFSTDHHSGIFKNSYEVIPNGIKISKEITVEDKFDTFTFLAVGRLESMKNHIELISITKKLIKKYSFRIIIAGEGPLRQELEKSIDENGLKDTIKLLGFRNDILSLCQKSHVFIMPSLWEGLPVSILEAGSVKLPVITTSVGSIPSLIDEETGFIGNISLFPEFMEQTIIDYDTAKRKGVGLFKRIQEEYSNVRFIDRHIKLYEQSIKNYGSSKS